MIPSILARLSGASAFRKVVAVLLAGCAAGFVLGQAAGHQPHRVVATLTSPARTAAAISGALSTPVVAPPHSVVSLSAPGARQGEKHGGEHQGDDGHDGDGHDVPHAMPLPNPHHGGDHHKDGVTMPPVATSEDE